MVLKNQNMRIQLFCKSFDIFAEPKRGRNPWEVRQNSRTLIIEYFQYLSFCIMCISFWFLRLIFGGSTFFIVQGFDYNGFGWRGR
jgi:hypothetical protein